MEDKRKPSFYENNVLMPDLSVQVRIADYPVGQDYRPVYDATAILPNPNRSSPKLGRSPLEMSDAFIEIEFSEQAVRSYYRNLPAHSVAYSVKELEDLIKNSDFYKAKLVLGGLIYNPHVEKNEQLISRVKALISSVNTIFISPSSPHLVSLNEKYLKVESLDLFIKTHIGVSGFEDAISDAKIKIKEIMQNRNSAPAPQNHVQTRQNTAREILTRRDRPHQSAG